MRKKKILKPAWILLISGFVLVYTIGIIWVTTVERKANPKASYTQQIEDSIIVLMGEYPEKPKTMPAQIFRIFLLGIGVVLFGAVVGKISSIFVTNALTVKNKMKKFKNHIIICNWNENAVHVIEQLRGNEMSQDLDIIVISTDKVEVPDFDKLFFRQSDPTQYKVLKDNFAEFAKTVILLADNKTEKPDDKNALIALAVKHLETDKKIDVHVVAELVDKNRERHLTDAGVDEFVCVGGIAAGMLAQCALFQDLSHIYARLLSYSNDTNEIYFLFNSGNGTNQPVHPKLIDQTFSTASEYVNDYRKANNNHSIMLLGLKQDGKVLLNPPGETKIKSGDSLIFMAFNYSQLEKFSKWLSIPKERT